MLYVNNFQSYFETNETHTPHPDTPAHHKPRDMSSHQVTAPSRPHTACPSSSLRVFLPQSFHGARDNPQSLKRNNIHKSSTTTQHTVPLRTGECGPAV